MLLYCATGKKHSSSAQSSAWAEFRTRRTGQFLRLRFAARFASLQRLTVGSPGLPSRRQGETCAYTILPCSGVQMNSSVRTRTR